MSLSPLACPLIAALLRLQRLLHCALVGLTEATIFIVLAVAINYLMMRGSRFISQWLTKFNLMGAIIRITGLAVMTMGMQALLDGLRIWWKCRRQNRYPIYGILGAFYGVYFKAWPYSVFGVSFA